MTKPTTISDVTKDSPSQQSFLAKVGQDEPIFILRGRDALAAATIEAWIRLAEEHYVSQAKIEEAKAHLDRFDDYSVEHATRLPD